MTKKRKIIYVILAFLIPFILELTVFNYNYYSSLFYPKEVTIKKFKTVTKKDSNSTLLFFNLEKEKTDIKSIYFDIDVEKVAGLNLTIYDEAHSNGYSASTYYLFPKDEQSKYLKVHSNGKVIGVSIEGSEYDDEQQLMVPIENFKVKKAVINARAPFTISLLRYIVITSIFVIAVLIKIGIFNIPFSSFMSKKYAFAAVLIISGSFLFLCMHSNYVKMNNRYVTNHAIYNVLAVSLSHGHYSLDVPVSDTLKSLENPYDHTVLASLKENKDYFLDFAYYKGKYYCYYGITPVLLIYLPYYIFTKNLIANIAVLIIGCIAFTIACFMLVYQLFKKYWPKATSLWYLSCSSLLAITSGVFMVIRKGYFYGIPIVFASAFTLFGLALWLSSIEEKKVNKIKLFLGATCMALVAGCRPQMLLYSGLSLVIFIPLIKKKKINWKHYLLFFLPFIIFGAFLMNYNYARFGSIFDFGARYNLTSNDMTKRGWVLSRGILGIFSLLFEFPHINSVFPFINYYNIETTYVGETIFETMAGGFVAFNLLSILSLLVPFFKKELKENKLFTFSLVNLIIAIIIAFIDSEVAGILPRYIMDFGPMLFINTIIMLNILKEKYETIPLITKTFVILSIIAIVYSYLSFFTDGFMNYQYIKFFYKCYYTFMFWT